MRRIGYFLIFVCVLATVCAVAYFRPYYNFDMVQYIGAACGSTDMYRIHATAYSAIKQIPPDKYEDLVKGNDYRADLRRDPAHFAEGQLIYSIKPLYVLAIKAASKVTSYVRAVILVSVVSYFCMGLLLWCWMGRWINGPAVRLTTCCLLCVFPEFVSLARFCTPDAAGMLLVLAGLYLAAERTKPVLGVGMLLISIWIRPDNAILAILVVGMLLWIRRISLSESAILALLAAASIWCIDHCGGAYSWGLLFEHSFGVAQVAPAEVSVRITATRYLSQLLKGAATQTTPILCVYLLFGLVCIWKSDLKIYKGLCIASLLGLGARFILFPTPDPRFYGPNFAIWALAGIRTIAYLPGRVAPASSD